MKRFLSLFLTLLIFITALLPFPAFAEDIGNSTDTATNEKTLKILFTHDIHSYFDATKTVIDGKVRDHGGAARLKTLIDQNSDENTIYLDAGDFSMGTLLQAGYSTDAYELRLLGELGCAVTTFGNHEFDQGGYGAAKMLNAALSSGDRLPAFVQSNMITTGELTEEQKALTDAMNAYGVKSYTILQVNGLRVGVFGLLGIDGIECAPTSGMDFENYIDAAKRTVKAIKEDGADVIICLSHCGTSGDGKNGEDFDLAREVPEIDVIISGHSHTTYPEVVLAGKTILGSTGEYLAYLGSLTVTIDEDGVKCTDYRLIPCDQNVAEDMAMALMVDGFKHHIEDTYLAAENVSYDQILCHSDFDFITLREMYATHQEYTTGNLIADSYLYEARRNGINDIDVALVGLGTIRGSFYEGDITVADAFEICSLGVGKDGSTGHPILGAYITGKELKLLVELDASLGPLVSSIKMSYAGLRYTFNTKRMLLDRVTEVYLVREDGTEEEIQDQKLYKVACNMYAANMLGMLNGLTHGILAITPKYADGTVVEDFYTCSLLNTAGNEIKEWVAFKNYLSSFPVEKDGIPHIPEDYRQPQGRKLKIAEGGLALIRHPGATTLVVILVPTVLLAMIIVLIATRKARKAKRIARRAARKAKAQ